MAYTLEELGSAIDRLVKSGNASEKEDNMNDIAGLLALMQGNKGMDLPGLLALAKEKGYDKSFGGEGMFLFVFLILFLFAGGGWGNMNRGQQVDFAALAGSNTQEIVGLHDRISAAQATSTQGFQQLQTWLCESIANVTNTVRTQGDRATDAINNTDKAVAALAYELNNKLTELNGNLALQQEKNNNALLMLENRLMAELKENRNMISLGFERQACLLKEMNTQQELERLRRENAFMAGQISQQAQTQAIINGVQNFALSHYTVTKTDTSSSGSGTTS